MLHIYVKGRYQWLVKTNGLRIDASLISKARHPSDIHIEENVTMHKFKKMVHPE